MDATLRSIDAPRQARPAEPARLDWLLFGAIAAATVIEAAVRPELPPAVVALGIALLPTVLWRRSRPLLMVALVFGAAIVFGLVRLAIPADLPAMNASLFVLVLPYALVRHGSTRAIAAGSGFIALAAAIGFVAERSPLGEVIGGAALLLAVMAAGAAVRFRARAGVQEIEQARSREREHIARELHDTVAHHVSAIAIRAQAGLATAMQPNAMVDALRDIESEASRALADMRSMVGVLRVDGRAERAPMPGTADLERLRRSGDGAPDVEVRISGDTGDLMPSVASAIYRLAQEAVTNARRHATDATRVEVDLEVDDELVRLQVTDDGDAARSPGRARPGFGLIGMAERAAMLGGTFDAGPRAGRGWRVAATLPRRRA